MLFVIHLREVVDGLIMRVFPGRKMCHGKMFYGALLIVSEYNSHPFPLGHPGGVYTIVLIEYMGSGTCMNRKKHTYLPRFLLVYAVNEVGELKYKELQHELCFHVYFKV